MHAQKSAGGTLTNGTMTGWERLAPTVPRCPTFSIHEPLPAISRHVKLWPISLQWLEGWPGKTHRSVALCCVLARLAISSSLCFSQLHPKSIFSSTVWRFLFYSRRCCKMLQLHAAEFPSRPLLSSGQECTLYVIISSFTPYLLRSTMGSLMNSVSMQERE